jgi:hypothetical protein
LAKAASMSTRSSPVGRGTVMVLLHMSGFSYM